MKLKKEQISQIAELTDCNDHTSARLLIIEAMKSEVQKCNVYDQNDFELLINSYKFIEEQHNLFGHLPYNLSIFRNETDKTFKLWIFKLVSNADQVWQAL